MTPYIVHVHQIRDVRVYFPFFVLWLWLASPSNESNPIWNQWRSESVASIHFDFFIIWFVRSTRFRPVVCCRSGNSVKINKRDYFAVRFITDQLRVYSMTSVKQTRESSLVLLLFFLVSTRLNGQKHRLGWSLSTQFSNSFDIST